MKQVVFIINSMQCGGAERVVATQANYLAMHGFDVTLLLFRRRIQYELSPKVRIIFLSEEERFSPAEYLFRLPRLVDSLSREIDKIVRRGEVALLTTHLLFPHLVTRLSRYRSDAIYVQHCIQAIVPFASSPFYHGLLRWIYRNRKLVGVSNAVMDELRTVYAVRTPYARTIYNPLDFDAIDRKLEETVSTPRPVLLFCGRLTKQKRPERVIDAFYSGGFFTRYDLILLGEGDLREALEERVRRYGIEDHVLFRGWEPNVYKWMKAASLLLLTSEAEGLGMVLIEALYCGCPVVASRCPGMEELFRGPLARYLCEPDTDSIVRTIQDALECYPGDRRSFALEFGVERNIQNYLDTYREWDSIS